LESGEMMRAIVWNGQFLSVLPVFSVN